MTLQLKDQTVEELQDLIRINIDSCKGFEQAAETIDTESIQRLFRQIARDRRHHVHELRRFVDMTDKDAEDSGSIKGAVHRWWLTARGKLNGGDDHVVLIEAERGEDAIKKRYEDAFEKIDNPQMKQLITRQYSEIKRGHDAVRDLRDLAAQND